jgi:CTP:molybdopterin cytidylyltransferase MocA
VTVIGIVLAAGASRRMGTPKALARVGTRTFIAGTLEALQSTALRIVVVAPPHAEAIRRELRGDSLLTVENPAPERGMLSSLQVGLAAAPPGTRAAVVSLIDHPRVRPETVAALIGAWQSRSAAVVRPRFGGRGGHPFVIDRALFEPLLAAPPSSHLGKLLGRSAPRCDLEVADPTVLDDFDTLSDLAQTG